MHEYDHRTMCLHRSHKDLMKDAAPHYKKAHKFYDGLAAQLVQQGHALDVFACSLDQVWVTAGVAQALLIVLDNLWHSALLML